MGEHLAIKGVESEVWTSEKVIEFLRDRALKVEVIQIKGREALWNFYNPAGMDVSEILDPEHEPSVKIFQTVIISDEFAKLRGKPQKSVPKGVKEVPGSFNDLRIISEIAADEENYKIDDWVARTFRSEYLKAAARAMRGIFLNFRPKDDDVLVGVKRCGSNILRATSWSGVEVDAKRLRFKNNPDLLGAGTNIDQEVGDQMEDKNVRLVEGVVAAGTTESVIAVALKNMGVKIKTISCDAVVICSAGAKYARDVKRELGVYAPDRSPFVGGELDKNWYVRYSKKDRLIALMGKVFNWDTVVNFEDKQILGDGGDLTSNI